MRYSIHQIAPNRWELRAQDGTVVATYTDAPGFTGYDQACVQLGVIITERRRLAAADGQPGDGMLAERWVSDAGIAFSIDTPGGRDFSACKWSWRDPTASLVPLMFQTETDFGHYGAELAGFCEEFSQANGTVAGAGRFYDTDMGTQARDTLLDGRRFGVSVDASENVDVEEFFTCIEFDDDGWCLEGNYRLVFNAYEIAGLTMTPFPCFENASIVLDTAAASAQPVRASVHVPLHPPRAWMTLAEPRPGAPFLDGMGDDVLVEQRNRDGEVMAFACPLTITDDGLVYSHLTWWGECHVADPWGPGVCASASRSQNGYADFLTGVVTCDDGTSVPSGVLTVGCEHSAAFDAPGVRDHLAHAGMGWADVHVVDGVYGPWMSGSLKPTITDAQVRLLRSLSLSGEWLGELCGVLAVNTPGLPVQRALAASAFGDEHAPTDAKQRLAASGGKITKLVGANIVRRCPECAKRQMVGGADALAGARAFNRVLGVLEVIERRTRHLVADEAVATAARVRRSA